MASPVSSIIVNTLSSPAAWDKGADDYPKVGSFQFTQGFAKDCWDASVTNTNNVKVLDIACGTGALAIPAAQALKETGGQVLATDFSPKMVEITRESAKSMGLPNIECRVEDGQNLLSADNTFDYAFSIFGLFMFPDQAKGLSEAYRVLKPGGKFAVTSWTTQNTMIALNEVILKRYNKTLEILQFLQLGKKEHFIDMMTKAGFKDVKIIEITKDMPIADHKKFIYFLQNNPGFTSTQLELNITKEKFEEEMLSALQEKFPNLPTTSSNTALLAIGTK